MVQRVEEDLASGIGPRDVSPARTNGTRWVSSLSMEIFDIMSTAAVPVLSLSEQAMSSSSVYRQGQQTYSPKAVVWYNPSTLSIAQVRISCGDLPSSCLLNSSICCGVN